MSDNSKSDWLYDTGVVLTDQDDRWWHVLSRYRDVDTWDRFYTIADATHTEYKDRIEAEWVESDFESAGWTSNTKPAVERGYRVNGVLCGPSDVDHWKGQECLPERECPDCGVQGLDPVDVIVDMAEDRAYCECRTCGHEWEIDDE